MSLIVCVYVPTGIVLSGDSRMTMTVSQTAPNPQAPTALVTTQTNTVLSDAANKVFILHGRVGVGAFGDALVNNMPIAHYMQEFQASAADPAKATVKRLATDLLQYFRSLAPIPAVNMILAGYAANEPWVMSLDVAKDTAQRLNFNQATQALQYATTFGGDTAIVNRLLSQPQFNPPFQLMNLQDAIDFSRHLIRSTIDQMRFEPRFPTVGGPIDTLVINPAAARFLAEKSLSA